MALDKINNSVLHSSIKNEIASKVTQAELLNLKNSLENQINDVYSNILRKQPVPTFSDLITTYPNPKEGWTVTVDDSNITYQYDKDDGLWFPTSINAIPKATNLIDGLMTKELVSKLNTMQNNAEVNKTIHEILSELKNVDGANSGLDADLLDGKHASSFASATHNHDGTYYKKNEVDILVGAKYTKPSTGIPKTDLASVLQTEINDKVTLSDISWNNLKNKPTSSTTNIDDAINKKHTHSNSSVLNKIIQSGTESSIDISKFATKDELGQAGYGDMLKSVYDTDNDGIVDVAKTVQNVTSQQVNHIEPKLVTDTPDTYPIGISIFGVSQSETVVWRNVADSSLSTGTTFALVETNVGVTVSGSNLRYLQRVTFVYDTESGNHGTYEREGYLKKWQPFKKVLNSSDVVNDLVTENDKKPLSASQGKVLNETINTHLGEVTQLINGITNESLINLPTNQFSEAELMTSYPVGLSIMRVNLSSTVTWAEETSGFLVVETMNTDNVGIQRITRYNNDATSIMNIYERRYARSSWGNWYSIVTSHSFSKVEAKETYLTCVTAVGTTAKTATRFASNVSYFSLEVGMTIKVKFSNSNTATATTLNVHATGAKPMLKQNGSPFNKWSANGVYTFVYDGSAFISQSTTGGISISSQKPVNGLWLEIV